MEEGDVRVGIHWVWRAVTTSPVGTSKKVLDVGVAGSG